MLYATALPTIFNLKQCRLEEVEHDANTSWHPLFATFVLALDFPIPIRNGEVGVELPLEAMVELAGVIGAVECQGGVVLKGFSTAVLPVSTQSLPPADSDNATLWRCVYGEKDDLLMLSSLAAFKDRRLIPLEDLDSLIRSRNFLAWYEDVNATSDEGYSHT